MTTHTHTHTDVHTKTCTTPSLGNASECVFQGWWMRDVVFSLLTEETRVHPSVSICPTHHPPASPPDNITTSFLKQHKQRTVFFVSCYQINKAAFHSSALLARQHIYYTFWTKRKSSEIFILTSRRNLRLLQTQIKSLRVCRSIYCVYVWKRFKGQETGSEASTRPSGATDIEKGKIQKHSSDSRVKVWPARGASWSSEPAPLNRKRCFLTGNTRLNMQGRQVICSELQPPIQNAVTLDVQDRLADEEKWVRQSALIFSIFPVRFFCQITDKIQNFGSDSVES